MVEQNPLQDYPAVSCTRHTNKKGRPRKGNVICFGPQPQSMVSKLLNQIKTDCNIQILTEKHDYDETISITSTPVSKPEPDSTNGDDYHKKSKRRKKSEVKEPAKPKTYSCDYENCSYSTKLASNMTKHTRIHTGEKPYLCDRCSFRSNFINSLKCHKRLHTEVRPYKCSECSYSCNSISNLKKHCNTRHKDYQFVEKIGCP